MDGERWRQVERVLDAALASDPATWPMLLEKSCSGDPELRAEVEALLDRLDLAEGFLTSRPTAIAAALLESRNRPSVDLTGVRLGAYRIVGELGRGGMASVYLAERADGAFERQVALKLLRPGLDSEHERERFRVERQILATLDHPNIARLFDGGVTPDGRPYLVLERVQGRPIDAYCDERGLGMRARVRLFLTVCDATRYAHGRLVVHGDLKPSSILVAEDGVAKLLDFGLATLLQPRPEPDAAAATRHRWMTPDYAAPEQVVGAPVTALTDVYQLGAVLHRILTGRVPFDGRRSLIELEAAIRHEPPIPPSVAYPARRRELRGDLDAIVLKALGKEPDARYASAEALAADLRRHLSGHPVHARPRSVAYRTGRFVGRHRVGVAAAATIVLLAGAYTATVTVQRARIRTALAEARLGTQRASQVTDLMLELFQASEGGRALSDTVTARELLDRGLARAEELSGQPAMQAQMLDVIGRIYMQLGEYNRAMPILGNALAIRRDVYGEEHLDYVTSVEHLAEVRSLTQLDVAETVRLRRQALELRRRLSGPAHPATADAMFELSSALHHAGDRAAAFPLFEEWLALIERHPPERTAQRAVQLESAGILLWLRGEPERAEALLRDALAARRELYGDRHPMVAGSMLDLAGLFQNQGRHDDAYALNEEAVRLLRRSYPDGHLLLAEAIRDQGRSLTRLQRHEEAIPVLRESLVMLARYVDESALIMGLTRADLAVALTFNGQPAEAEAEARAAIRSLSGELGVDNSVVVVAHITLGDALRAGGRYAEAEPLLLAGYERFREPRPVTEHWRRYALAALIRLYEAQGRTAEAEKYRTLVEAG